MTEETTASILKVKDEFKSFVKPTWRPTLSDFCTQLTGIRQVYMLRVTAM
jgi:3'-5' exoribonuclease 1